MGKFEFQERNLLNVNGVEEKCVEVNGKEFKFMTLSMGNPHAVIFVDSPEDLSLYLKNYGQ